MCPFTFSYVKYATNAGVAEGYILNHVLELISKFGQCTTT